MSMKFQKSLFCFCFIFIISLSSSLSATADGSGSSSFDLTITFQTHSSGNFIIADNFFVPVSGRLTLANSSGKEFMVLACIDGGRPIIAGIIADADSLDVTHLLDSRTGLTDLEIKILPINGPQQTFTFIMVD